MAQQEPSKKDAKLQGQQDAEERSFYHVNSSKNNSQSEQNNRNHDSTVSELLTPFHGPSQDNSHVSQTFVTLGDYNGADADGQATLPGFSTLGTAPPFYLTLDIPGENPVRLESPNTPVHTREINPCDQSQIQIQQQDYSSFTTMVALTEPTAMTNDLTEEGNSLPNTAKDPSPSSCFIHQSSLTLPPAVVQSVAKDRKKKSEDGPSQLVHNQAEKKPKLGDIPGTQAYDQKMRRQTKKQKELDKDNLILSQQDKIKTLEEQLAMEKSQTVTLIQMMKRAFPDRSFQVVNIEEGTAHQRVANLTNEEIQKIHNASSVDCDEILIRMDPKTKEFICQKKFR